MEFTRKTVCNGLLKLLDRIKLVNEGKADLPYPQRIKTVIVYGSYVNNPKEKVHDCDIYIELEENREQWQAFAAEYDKRSGYVDFMSHIFFAADSLNKYLKVSNSFSFTKDLPQEDFERIVLGDTHIVIVKNYKVCTNSNALVQMYMNAANAMSVKTDFTVDLDISRYWYKAHFPVKSVPNKLKNAVNRLFTPYCKMDMFELFYCNLPNRYLENNFATTVYVAGDGENDNIYAVNKMLADRVFKIKNIKELIDSNGVLNFKDFTTQANRSAKTSFAEKCFLIKLCDFASCNDELKTLTLFIMFIFLGINPSFFIHRWEDRRVIEELGNYLKISDMNNICWKKLENRFHGLLWEKRQQQGIPDTLSKSAYIRELFQNEPLSLVKIMYQIIEDILGGKDVLRFVIDSEYASESELCYRYCTFFDSKPEVDVHELEKGELPFNQLRIRV